MTPYTILQLLYLGLAFVVASVFFKTTKISKTLRASLILRLITCEALLGGVGTIVFLTLAKTYEMTRAFGVVAVVFYAGALWMPVFALLSARRGTQSRVAGILAALAAIGIGGYAFFYEPNRLVLREEEMSIPEWTGKPFRLVHISDLQTVGHCGREDAAVEMINAQRPDLIVCTGDFVAGPWFTPDEGIESPGAIAAAQRFFGALKARLGVVLIAGHSEPAHIREAVVRDLDVTYLRNRTISFPLEGGRQLLLYGIDSVYPEMPPKGLRKEPGDVVVVASHVPDFLLTLGEYDLDLFLAGHTHGGQIVIPGFGPPLTLTQLPRDQAHGFFRRDEHRVSVTSGIGMEGHHAPRIRFFCPPEVVVIRIGGERESVPAGAKKE